MVVNTGLTVFKKNTQTYSKYSSDDILNYFPYLGHAYVFLQDLEFVAFDLRKIPGQQF